MIKFYNPHKATIPSELKFPSIRSFSVTCTELSLATEQLGTATVRTSHTLQKKGTATVRTSHTLATSTPHANTE